MSHSLAARPSIEARERILRAAEKLFAEKGYAATSVQEITVAAAVNKALLYYYFEDKHDLYACLIDDGTTEFRQVVDGALNGPGSSAERLRRLVYDHVDLMWRRSDLLRMVHRCLMAGDQEEFQLVEKFQATLAPLEQFFADAAASGEFRPVDPKMAARSVIGLDTGFAFCRIYQEQPFTQTEVANHVADLLLRGLAAA
jgi:AcrR family transcriptional regulator